MQGVTVLIRSPAGRCIPGRRRRQEWLKRGLQSRKLVCPPRYRIELSRGVLVTGRARRLTGADQQMTG